MEIKIENLTEDEISIRGIRKWSFGTKEISKFDWYYDSKEQCLFLAGKVIVSSDFGDIEVKKGDFVTFPKGLKCAWNVLESVEKHYQFD